MRIGVSNEIIPFSIGRIGEKPFCPRQAGGWMPMNDCRIRVYPLPRSGKPLDE